MKWIPKTPAKRGDRRMRSGFLFFPKTINGLSKWLVIAEWLEELSPHPDLVPHLHPLESAYWYPIRWKEQVEIPFQRFNLRPPIPPPPPPAKPMHVVVEFGDSRYEGAAGMDMLAKKMKASGITIEEFLKKVQHPKPADESAYQGVPMVHGQDRIAKPEFHTEATASKEEGIAIADSRLADLQKFYLPENHAFRSVYRTLQPEEAALSRAIKDQAYVLLQLLDMVPPGDDQHQARLALKQSVMWGIRAITA